MPGTPGVPFQEIGYTYYNSEGDVTGHGEVEYDAVFTGEIVAPSEEENSSTGDANDPDGETTEPAGNETDLTEEAA